MFLKSNDSTYVDENASDLKLVEEKLNQSLSFNPCIFALTKQQNINLVIRFQNQNKLRLLQQHKESLIRSLYYKKVVGDFVES